MSLLCAPAIAGTQITASSISDLGLLPPYDSGSTVASMLAEGGGYWNPVLPGGSTCSYYSLQVSFKQGISINKVVFSLNAGDQAHGPTGLSVYNKVTGGVRLASLQTGCGLNATACLGEYTVTLAPAFTGTSLLINVEKTSQYQIWMFAIKFYSCK